MNDAAPANYQVIARRYRPRFFREVVGQEAIAETLQHAIEKDRLAHAYLFCGPRGVGKTSMARIFARALQCPNAATAGTGEACDNCDVCERIFRGEDFDVVEMDGASNRGIDDIRELIHNVRFAPSSGRYRIFIVDEVHMLTREAFNALLKTLEEPPSHVKFIFATTEPEKILPTVLSRCQRCDFASISVADIVRRLQQICEAENATPEDGLLDRVADLARGGMRDSQSLLDQVLSFSGSNPTLAELNRITGRLAPESIRELVDRLDAGDRAGIVHALVEIEARGTDPHVVLEQVIEEVRERLHVGVGSDWDDVSIERNLLVQEILQEARWRMKQVGRADILLEVALLRASTFRDLVPLGRWADDLEGGGRPAGGSPSSGPSGSGGRPSNGPSSRGPSSPGSSPAAPAGGGSSRPSPTRPRGEASPGPAPKESAAAPPPAAVEASPVAVSSVAVEATDRSPVGPGAPTDPSPTRSDPAASSPSSINGGTSQSAVAEANGTPDLDGVRACMEEVSTMLAGVVGDRMQLQGDRVQFRLDAGAKRLIGPKVDALRSALRDRFGRPFFVDVIEAEAVVAKEESAADGFEAAAVAPTAPASPARAVTPDPSATGGPAAPSFDESPAFDGPPDAVLAESIPYEAEASPVPPTSEPVPHPSPIESTANPIASESLPDVAAVAGQSTVAGRSRSTEVGTPEIVAKAVEIFRGKIHSHRPPLDPDQLAGR